MGLLGWVCRLGGPRPARLGRRPTPPPLGGELDAAIESIVLLVEDTPAYKSRVAQLADELGPIGLRELLLSYPRPTAVPPDLSWRRHGEFGSWDFAWQLTILQILESTRGRGSPLLREIAFGKYGGRCRSIAIVMLCNLAAEGVDRDRTLGELMRRVPRMRSGTLDEVARFIDRTGADPAREAIVAELRKVDAFDRAVRGLEVDA